MGCSPQQLKYSFSLLISGFNLAGLLSKRVSHFTQMVFVHHEIAAYGHELDQGLSYSNMRSPMEHDFGNINQ